MKNFRLTFVKIALCGVVGSERKIRGFGKLPNKQNADAFYGKGYSFPMLAEKLLTSIKQGKDGKGMERKQETEHNEFVAGKEAIR